MFKKKRKNFIYSYEIELKDWFFLNFRSLDLILKSVNEYKQLEIHQQNASRQRNAYNRQRSDTKLLESALLIEFDFKQNITIGKYYNFLINNKSFSPKMLSQQ